MNLHSEQELNTYIEDQLDELDKLRYHFFEADDIVAVEKALANV